MPTKIEQIQAIIGTPVDGKWGPASETALNAIIRPAMGAGMYHHGRASSFADPRDIEAFRKCKAKGKSDQDCFKVGDNGIGCYGDDCSQGSGPSCALPPEDSEEKWGSVAEAKHKLVEVTSAGHRIICVLKDRMPHRANIKNHAIIDLNPDAVAALGLIPPIMIPCSWRWV